jgi:hypothetical protein
MDNTLLRVKALQCELAEIVERNRQYLEKKRHSPNERADHEAWRERVYEIRSELFAVMEKSTQKAA